VPGALNVHDVGLYRDHIQLVKFGRSDVNECKQVTDYIKWIVGRSGMTTATQKWDNWESERRMATGRQDNS